MIKFATQILCWLPLSQVTHISEQGVHGNMFPGVGVVVRGGGLNKRRQLRHVANLCLCQTCHHLSVTRAVRTDVMEIFHK